MKLRSAKPLIVCVLDGGGRALPNACAYIRLILPLSQPEVHKHFDVRFITASELSSYRPDVVVAQRLAFNSDKEIEALTAQCRKLGSALVYEIDDDLLSIAQDHSEYAHYRSASHSVKSLASEAREVWVSTAQLAERFARLNPNTVILQNTLDQRIWRQPTSRVSNGVVRILYMGTVSHSGDFRTIFLPAFQKLESEMGDRIETTLVGVSPDWRDSRGIHALPVPAGVGASYPAFAHWLQETCRQDIGVAPLTDTEFNRAKSHIKWLEYSALGLATVASDLGEYSDSIKHGDTGMLAGANWQEFYEAMRETVVNASLRQKIARGAKNLAIQQLDNASIDGRRASRLACLTGLEIDASLR